MTGDERTDTAEVLAEFGAWLVQQPDTPSKRWIQGNMPGASDVDLPTRVWRSGFRLALPAFS